MHDPIVHQAAVTFFILLVLGPIAGLVGVLIGIHRHPLKKD